MTFLICMNNGYLKVTWLCTVHILNETTWTASYNNIINSIIGSTEVVGQLTMIDRWVVGCVVLDPQGAGKTTSSRSVTVPGPATMTPTSPLWSDRPYNTGGTGWPRRTTRPRSNNSRGRRSSKNRNRKIVVSGWWRILGWEWFVPVFRVAYITILHIHWCTDYSVAYTTLLKIIYEFEQCMKLQTGVF